MHGSGGNDIIDDVDAVMKRASASVTASAAAADDATKRMNCFEFLISFMYSKIVLCTVYCFRSVANKRKLYDGARW